MLSSGPSREPSRPAVQDRVRLLNSRPC
uniref:Uncharacterized protein n=1 Tax=Arundo donax TaxID=35708 RepID=A0A0A8YWT8_ARUDO